MPDPIRTFRHVREMPDTLWRWPNFSPAEIACRGTGALKLHPAALDKLQALRDRLGKPLILRSAYRSPEHNRAVRGAPQSKHMDGTAFDIAMSNHDPVAFEVAARAVGFLGFGYYPRSGFMHIDLGPARIWGEPFPPRPVPFAIETPPRARHGLRRGCGESRAQRLPVQPRRADRGADQG
jgi:zinc D-Ala-D-Ala carboxypeptidase